MNSYKSEKGCTQAGLNNGFNGCSTRSVPDIVALRAFSFIHSSALEGLRNTFDARQNRNKFILTLMSASLHLLVHKTELKQVCLGANRS